MIPSLDMPKPWSPSTSIIWGIIAASLGLHTLIFVLSTTILKNWRFEHLPIHTLVEALGSAIALLVAYKLLSYRKHNFGPKYATRIAQALIVMGVLDGFHAANHVGNNFVWLHSIATFLGGLFFVFILLPQRYSLPLKGNIVLTIATFSLGISSLLFPEIVPVMVDDGSFTFTANLLNFVGGVFLILAAVRLVVEYRRSKSVHDLLFSMHCLLFGLAALMFQFSVLWDASWWGWHLLRMLAYLVAVVFIVSSEWRLLQQFGQYGFEMNQLAFTDPLTTVHNRRYFDEQIVNEYRRATRYGNKLAVVMLDIDHFKALNDRHGHAEGDKVLISLTKCIKQHLRSNDLIARIGGEEFALILPSTSKKDALNLVERIRKEFETMTVRTNQDDEIRATASFGIAELTSNVNSEKELLEYADRALYTAKRNGRNRTMIYAHAVTSNA